jgi:Fur family peroxide stress response transcriptional regulator
MKVRERKHSKKRDAILNLIQSTTVHPGARWVYERLKPAIPDLSLGTVYRNLNIFTEEGTALSLGVVGGEERFDGVTRPHPHLVCTRCGRVADLPCRAEGESAGAPAEAEHAGFLVDYRRTVFYGLCGECRNRERRKHTGMEAGF